VRADDFMHVYFFSFLANICMSASCGAPGVPAICQWSPTPASAARLCCIRLPAFVGSFLEPGIKNCR
jgi:hypothetical protein